MRQACETSHDRPAFVTAGKDSFESILLGTGAGGKGGVGEGNPESGGVPNSKGASAASAGPVSKVGRGQRRNTRQCVL